MLTFSAPFTQQTVQTCPTGSPVVASAVRTFEESNTNITRTVIVGNNTIVYSDSGTSFTEASSIQDLNYVGVAAINSGWMAIDGNGRCKFSTNGSIRQMQEQTY